MIRPFNLHNKRLYNNTSLALVDIDIIELHSFFGQKAEKMLKIDLSITIFDNIFNK